jgi:diguanylate cyclase (GGDEF)-like protein
MSRFVNASVEMSHALISASPDILFVINNNKIEPISAGENSWLDLKKLAALSLDELFTEPLKSTLLQGIEAAREAPEKRSKVELILGPDQPQIWGYLGLDKGQVFELTLVPFAPNRTLVSMRNTTELSRLQQAHLRDPLTGLRSHRALITVLEKAFGEAQRFDNMRFALVIVDIDNFSDINDEYGWDAGDQVLKRFAEKVTATQRSSDFVCRFGDDLFAMLLSEADIGDAVGAGERLQKIAAAMEFDFAAGPLNLTLSVGTSAYVHEETESVQQMIREAQESLLTAQTRGGNIIATSL